MCRHRFTPRGILRHGICVECFYFAPLNQALQIPALEEWTAEISISSFMFCSGTHVWTMESWTIDLIWLRIVPRAFPLTIPVFGTQRSTGNKRIIGMPTVFTREGPPDI